ncbi:NAD(P)H-binding protein [Cytophaga aurantiaca]|uniref:NAD(P)H-binding protein n=1 Tax=Cytophaga aurantiaca TaxID=29530 RepID=UPI0003808949|nr:NAD(P)H-binding protein [Cytophaga aurantiaca]
MKYVITGSLGNISKPLAKTLIAAGHTVTVVSSQESRKAEIEALGAKAAIGSVQDVDFLTKTFTGADAVYTMVPPTFAAADWKKYIGDTGKVYADAIAASGVKNIVNLSSIGAHMAEGCGPVSGIHREEQALNTLSDVNIKHLRPGNFYTNLLNNIGMIKHANIIGANYGTNTSIVFVHPSDIAAVAVEELTALTFKGHTVRYVVSDERTTNDVAKVLGAAIGKPELPWIDFKDEDSFGGMVGAGLPEEIAKNFVEMGKAVREGKMFEDYNAHRSSVQLSKTKLEDFAKEFAAAFNQ